MSCINSTWLEMFIESTCMRYGHSQGGLTGITFIDKAIGLLDYRLHSCSQLVRNLASMRNELYKATTHHLEESNARIQADNSDRGKLRERLDQCIDRCDPSGHYAKCCVHHYIWKTDCCVSKCQECSTNWHGLNGSL